MSSIIEVETLGDRKLIKSTFYLNTSPILSYSYSFDIVAIRLQDWLFLKQAFEQQYGCDIIISNSNCYTDISYDRTKLTICNGHSLHEAFSKFSIHDKSVIAGYIADMIKVLKSL